MSDQLPTFVVIGAQKSGTTSLWRYLDQHPQVFMSPDKEPHFFAWEGRTEDLPGPQGAEIRQRAVADLDEYRALFAGAGDAVAVGEASTGYLQTPHAAENMARHVPDARLVALLRNPIDRAYSGFKHARRQGTEPIADFARALDAEPERVRESWTGMTWYVTSGRYVSQLEPYRERFHPEQIRIYLHDDLSRDPSGLLADLYRYLGVDDAFVPDTGEVHNAGRAVRSPRLERLLRRSPLVAAVRRALPDRIGWSLYRAVNERVDTPLDPRIRDRLATELGNDVERLGDLIGRDTTAWLEGRPVPPPDDGELGRHPPPLPSDGDAG